MEIRERALEDAIERALLEGAIEPGTAGAGATDADEAGGAGFTREPAEPAAYGPGGYHRRQPDEYDRARCLMPRDVLDFILATQPRTWARLKEHHGAEVKERFLHRLAVEVERRGTLDVLRHGLRDSGCTFQLAYFRPASGLNEETRRLYVANLFAAVRQLRYSAKTDHSLDLVLFLNGLPVFTVELKNPLTAQTVEHAIRQYQAARDPREPLFADGRCLAHFAVDPDLVYVTTRLEDPRTRFLPFNQGRFRGAGNPPVPPTHPLPLGADLGTRQRPGPDRSPSGTSRPR